MAPLVVNRKGVYTDLAKWAKARGHTHLRIDGEFVSLNPFPRIDRFKEHTIELPVADMQVLPANEALLRQALKTALEHGKGVVHLLAPLDGLTCAMNHGETSEQWARRKNVRALEDEPGFRRAPLPDSASHSRTAQPPANHP